MAFWTDKTKEGYEWDIDDWKIDEWKMDGSSPGGSFTPIKSKSGYPTDLQYANWNETD